MHAALSIVYVIAIYFPLISFKLLKTVYLRRAYYKYIRYKNAFKCLPQKDIGVFVLNIGYGTTLRTYEPFWVWLATSRHLAARKEGRKEGAVYASH